jgi:hypothetical protein
MNAENADEMWLLGGTSTHRHHGAFLWVYLRSSVVISLPECQRPHPCAPARPCALLIFFRNRCIYTL